MDNKNTNWRVYLYILLVVLAGILNAAVNDSSIIVAFIYLFLFFKWMSVARSRYIQKDMRKILTTVSLLIIVWMLTRTIKYEFTPEESVFARYLWYSYYIPVVLLPALLFNATLYLGRTDNSTISPLWKLIYILPSINIIGIFTNDIHRLAFSFNPGMKDWVHDYSHGILYYSALVMLVVFIIGVLVNVFRKCTTKRVIRYIWFPILVLGIGIAYSIQYANYFESKSIIQRMYEMPEFVSLFFISFWESLVSTHMISSNSNHMRFFAALSINAGLTDEAGNTIIRSSDALVPPPELIKQSVNEPVYMNEGNTLLKCHPVQGGFFYWMEDISEINRLNSEIEETGNYLQEEHDMLDAQIKLEESRKRTQEQNRLYDSINRSISPQLDKLEAILDELPEEEEGFREKMKYAAVISAYIKRRSNLLLLSASDNMIESEELGLSIAESLEYVRMCSAECHSQVAQGYRIPAEHALYMYELFENVLEEALSDTDAVLVTFREDKGQMVFYMETAYPAASDDMLLNSGNTYYDTTGKDEISIESEYSDGSRCITLRIRSAGDGI